MVSRLGVRLRRAHSLCHTCCGLHYANDLPACVPWRRPGWARQRGLPTMGHGTPDTPQRPSMWLGTAPRRACLLDFMCVPCTRMTAVRCEASDDTVRAIALTHDRCSVPRGTPLAHTAKQFAVRAAAAVPRPGRTACAHPGVVATAYVCAAHIMAARLAMHTAQPGAQPLAGAVLRTHRWPLARGHPSAHTLGAWGNDSSEPRPHIYCAGRSRPALTACTYIVGSPHGATKPATRAIHKTRATSSG